MRPTNGSTVTLNTCASTCSAGSGVPCMGWAASPSPFRKSGGLASSGLGSKLTITSSSSSTPAPLRAEQTHRDQVPFTQRLFQRCVQFGGVHVAVVEVAVEPGLVHVHHLLHQRAVRVVHAAEVAVAGTVEEAVHHLGGAGVGQVHRQAFLAEGGLDLRQQAGQVDAGHVDLVDDDEPVHVAGGGIVHHAHGHGLDADGGVDDHGRGFHRFQCGQALAQEVGAAGGVDEVDACLAAHHVHHGRVSECCILRSSGSKSLTVLPRSRVPGAPMAPVLTSSASARLVFPAAAGPTGQGADGSHSGGAAGVWA